MSARRIITAAAVVMLASFLLAGAAHAAAATQPITDDALLGGLLGDRAETVELLALMTVLSVLPSVLVMFTSFTRIIIVLGFLRNAMGTQQMPPNQVMVGLALFITLFVMSGPFDQIMTNAYDPYVNGQISQEEAVDEAMKPLREFMLKQTYKDDVNLFLSIAKIDDINIEENPEAIPTHVLMPAFLTSEIKHAFTMGFLIYVPFIVIDMVVASTLMSMGMMMLPPIMISMPFKVLIFILVNGWMMTIQTVILSFKMF